MYASSFGFLDMIDLLIENGATVDARTEQGDTSLLFSIKSKQLATIEKLLSKGAQVNLANNGLMTPLCNFLN